MRFCRALRVLVTAAVVSGLLPGTHALLESIEHLLHDGHLPSGAALAVDAGREHDGPDAEHGCTPLAHQWGCHVSLTGVLPDGPAIPEPADAARSMVRLVGVDQHFRSRSLDPPHRPPIP